MLQFLYPLPRPRRLRKMSTGRHGLNPTRAMVNLASLKGSASGAQERDRWHHPDGSVLNRAREERAAQQAAHEHRLGPIAEENLDLVVSEPFNHDEAPVVSVSTAEGESFLVHSNPGPSTDVSTDEGSTTASSHGHQTVTAGGQTETGFWRHGQWVARGKNSRRTESSLWRQGAAAYCQENSKVPKLDAGQVEPAWLLQFARDKQKRQQGELSTEMAPNSSQASSSATSSWTTSGDDWVQDPLTGWWSLRTQSSLSSQHTNWNEWGDVQEQASASSSSWNGWGDSQEQASTSTATIVLSCTLWSSNCSNGLLFLYLVAPKQYDDLFPSVVGDHTVLLVFDLCIITNREKPGGSGHKG